MDIRDIEKHEIEKRIPSRDECPGCSGVGVLSDDPDVMRCEMCGGVFTYLRPISKAQAYQFVAFHLAMKANAGPDGQFYFNFDMEQANVPGHRRVHGWADKATKRVVQWG